MRNRFLALMFLLWATDAVAADIGCGRDTDRNGSVDNWCTGADQDFDGYTTAQGDCDDQNWQVYPGTLTSSGCSAGSFRVCNRDASGYGICTALADITTTQIGQAFGGTPTNIYWLSADGSTDLHAGASASDPADYRCLGDTSYNATCRSDFRNGTNDIPAGRVFLLKAGTYTSYFLIDSTRYQLALGYSAGTSDNPIYIIGDPTGTVEIQGQGIDVSHKGIPIQAYESNYVVFDNIKLSGGYGAGVVLNGTNHSSVTRMYIVDVAGNGGSDNLAGISATHTVGETYGYNTVTHNQIVNTYNRADPTNWNNHQIVFFEGKEQKINYNVLLTTRSGGAGVGFKYKHAQTYTTWEFVGNFIKNTTAGCIEFDAPHGTIKNNLVMDCYATNEYCFKNVDAGGGAHFNDVTVEYNTCINGNALYFHPQSTYSDIGDPALTFRYNVFVDNKSSYDLESTHFNPMRISYYGDSASWSDIMEGGSNSGLKFVLTSNCYYNTEGTAFLATVMGGGAGDDYTSWSAWTAAGYETGSYNENPSLNSINNATSTHCSSWGYLGNTPTVAAAKTTLTIGKSGKRVVRR